MITSLTNAAVKRIVLLQSREKTRREEGVFITEGVRMFMEIPRDRLEDVYVMEGVMDGASQEVRDRLAETGYETVSEDVMRKMSDTMSPQGILSTVRTCSYSVEEILDRAGTVMLLDGLQDPGNLGTIFRSAEAFGAAGVIMSRDTVSIYNPKSVRSTMGALFRLPFVYAEDLADTVTSMGSKGITVYAAALQGGTELRECDLSIPCGIIVGNEGAGISDRILDKAKKRVFIPMKGVTESLNAAVAASVLLYEASRQKDQNPTIF